MAVFSINSALETVRQQLQQETHANYQAQQPQSNTSITSNSIIPCPIDETPSQPSRPEKFFRLELLPAKLKRDIFLNIEIPDAGDVLNAAAVCKVWHYPCCAHFWRQIQGGNPMWKQVFKSLVLELSRSNSADEAIWNDPPLTRPSQSPCRLDDLPTEIRNQILNDIAESIPWALMNAAAVCQSWHLDFSPVLWRAIRARQWDLGWGIALGKLVRRHSRRLNRCCTRNPKSIAWRRRQLSCGLSLMQYNRQSLDRAQRYGKEQDPC